MLDDLVRYGEANGYAREEILSSPRAISARPPNTDKPECAIIGGTPDERIAYATKLRRLGISVHLEVKQAKRASIFKRAAEANGWGVGGVYDLDALDDRAWLDRDDLMLKGV